MAKSKSDSSSSTGSSEPSTTKSTDTAKSSDKGGDSAKATKSSDTGGGSEKATKDSVGGTSQVHYGYFSSVRSDIYRSGWDSIWSDKPKGRRRKPKS